MRRIRIGIRGRLVLLALAAAFPGLLFIAYDILDEYLAARQAARREVTRLSGALAGHYLGALEDARTLLAVLSSAPVSERSMSEACGSWLTALMAEAVLRPERFTAIAAATLDGDIFCSSMPSPQPINLADRSYFRRAIETRDFIVGDYVVGRASGRGVVPVAYPATTADGGLSAVLTLGLSPAGVMRSNLALPANASVLLLDSAGTVLFRHPDHEAWAGRSVADSPLFELARRGGSADIVDLAGLDGEPRLFGHRAVPVGQNGHHLLVGLDRAEVYAAAQQGLQRGILVLVVTVAFSLAAGRAVGHRFIFRSVRELAEATRRLASGDLSVRASVPTGDELGQLSDQFNHMARALQQRSDEVDRSRAELEAEMARRQAVANELGDSEARHRRVIELIQDAIWIHTDGRLVFANRHAAQLFGAERAEDLVGRAIGELVHPEDLAKARERTRRVVEEGRPAPPLEMRFVGAGGRTMYLDVQAVPLTYLGKPSVMACGRDVTQRRQTDEQLRQSQKSEAVGQLAGGIAHDFNNILTVIIGNLELAADTAGSSPDLQEAIQRALTGAEKGSALTHRLLAFSRRQPLQPETVGINRLVAGMIDLLRRSLGEDIEIETRLDEHLWPAIADAGQLENALLNLAINARDAMPDGGKLTIETANAHLDAEYAERSTEVTPGDYAMLAVTDTGIGMSREVIQRAFEPFFTTKDVGKGSGLGLSMIYGFIKQSGGHARIYSEPGHGTTVRLYLPRAPDAAAAEPTLANDEIAGAPARETILVVEDQPEVRALAVSQLASFGYRVLEAENGPNALEVLRADPGIDLLFTDVVMPGGTTGWQLAVEAQNLRPGLKVLFTSGYTEVSSTHRGRLGKGAQLLSKPYRKADLARKVREVLAAP